MCNFSHKLPYEKTNNNDTISWYKKKYICTVICLVPHNSFSTIYLPHEISEASDDMQSINNVRRIYFVQNFKNLQLRKMDNASDKKCFV